jgi:protein SCO1/2
LIVLAAAWAGCSKSSTAKAEDAKVVARSSSAAGATTAEKRFPLTGEIISVVPERKALLVHHDEIKDFMPSMTMEFSVAPGDLAVAKAGQHIRAELIVGKDDTMRLEKIWRRRRSRLVRRRCARTRSSGAGAPIAKSGKSCPSSRSTTRLGRPCRSAAFGGKW